jgi:hypothetical protein
MFAILGSVDLHSLGRRHLERYGPAGHLPAPVQPHLAGERAWKDNRQGWSTVGGRSM